MTTSNVNIHQYSNYDGQEQEDYIRDTAYSAVENIHAADTDFDTQSIPIDEELGRQIVYAIESRISANKSYTDERINRINHNYDLYNSKINTANVKESLKVTIPEIYLATEKWVDEEYLKFEKFSDSIDIKDPNNTLDEYVIKMLNPDPKEDKSLKGYLDYFRSYVGIANEESRKKYSYFFRKGDMVKSLLKQGLKKSGFDSNVETLLKNGTISGHYVFKLWPKTKKTCRINQSKEKKYEKSDVYGEYLAFIPKDTRKLIFSKIGFEDGIIEEIELNFSDILNLVLDEYGEPRSDSQYDADQVFKLQSYLKENPSLTVGNTDKKTTNGTYSEDKESLKIAGKIQVFEGHCIPIKIPGKYLPGKKERAVNCLVTVVCVDNAIYFPISCRFYPYDKPQYYSCVFVERDGDCSGIGLPELLEKLQSSLNDLYSLKMAFVQWALYGIFFANSRLFDDPDRNFSNLEPGQVIPVELEDGLRVQDSLFHYKPDISVLVYADTMINQISIAIDRLSRKGPSETKIAPNPTATEATNIYAQQEKSVMRVGLRLNNCFLEMMNSIYVYYLNDLSEKGMLKVQGVRVLEPPTQGFGMSDPSILEKPAQVRNVEKTIDVSADEVFVPEYEFTISAIEDSEQQAIERQQFMQFLNTINTIGIYDPATGSARKFTDEMGKEVEINFYNLISKGANQNGLTQDEIWKEVPQPQQGFGSMLQPQLPSATPNAPISPTTPQPPEGNLGPEIPDLGASLQAAPLLGGVQNGI